MPVLANSTFLDFASWRTNAAAPSGGTPVTAFTFNVALVLDRANDPTALLQSNWATRQAAIADQTTILSTYGADPVKFNAVVNDLQTQGFTILDLGAPTTTNPQYITSAQSRTVWLKVDHTNFTTLFGSTATLKVANGVTYWDGNLQLSTTLTNNGVSGVWFDRFFGTVANPNPSPTPAASLQQGWQSPGNASSEPSGKLGLGPQTIAANYYNFPFTGNLWNPASSIAPTTGTIGLIEPSVGTSIPGGPPPAVASFQVGIDNYRASMGISTPATIVSVAPGGQQYPNVTPPAFNPAGERSLDFGVVTATNPQSTLVSYAGSGQANGANANPYTAYQAAFWDRVNNPAVITSSFSLGAQTAPGSPFLSATRELFVDAALRNITVFNDNGDLGSGAMFGNGLTNVNTSHSSPYAVLVGGTALSSLAVAATDATLADTLTAALANDPGTLWRLVAGGLTQLPSAGSLSTAKFVETVWNQYYVNGTTILNPRNNTGYLHDNTGLSGVDGSQAVPSYQAAYGLNPTTTDPSRLTGRGTPDVAANAGSNLFYTVPNPGLTANQSDDGTSAATPLWAALASQINTIFNDQGLPNLGYMNDLLYIAAAIAPASFNDITIGNSVSSFVFGGSYLTDSTAITPTGYGYSAGPGYDLVTGLGTPNGILLARTLTAIAHAQTSFATNPDMLNGNSTAGWTTGVAENLMFQGMSSAAANVAVGIGGGVVQFASTPASAFAWTARFAEQSLQSSFDPNLVRFFDKQAQGGVSQSDVAAGSAFSVSINGAAASAIQGTLTSAFDFADFFSGAGAVRVARPVAVAETVGAANDQMAIVRMRQGGEDSLSVSFYRVDDYTGKIGTLQPGDSGYAAAAAARTYLTTGGLSLAGPGYGNFAQSGLLHVNAGDLIAMNLVNQTSNTTYWAFAQANDMVNGQKVGHLWNYGLNTWGWEATRGGGDRDFNDLVVQLDFTSAFGHGWLV